MSQSDYKPTRLHRCSTHGQQSPNVWGCPECLRELREERRPVPIPLTERFPELADCDKEGNFWVGRLTSRGWRWLTDYNPTAAMSVGYTHWLPFNTQWLPAHPLL